MRRLFWIVGFVTWTSLFECAIAAPSVGKSQVATALDRLEGWLASGPHAQEWREYLHLDLLHRELNRPQGVDLEVLEATLRRLSENQPGLELPRFLELRTSLEGWLARATMPGGARLKAVTDSLQRRVSAERLARARPAALRLVAQQQPTEETLGAEHEFGNRLTALRALIAAYAQQPAPWLADEIGAALIWLEHTGKAAPLVAAVRDYYGQPNVWIDISERTLASGVEGAIERTIVVEDSILGTEVRGHGTTKATKTLVFSPHSERAVLRLRVRGSIETTTLGRNGPARIHSRAQTTFRAEKDFWLDESGLKAMPTICTAETQTVAASVSAASPGVRGRIVKRVALRQMRRQQQEADRVAARHAEAEIRELVDKEAKELTSQIERCAITPLLALADNSAGTLRLRFCSAQGLLRIGVIAGPLGAPPGGPQLPLESGLAIRLHSTISERLMRNSVAKMVLTSLQPSNPLTERLGAILPAGLTRKAGSWSQQLAQIASGASAETISPPRRPATMSLVSGNRIERAVQRWLNDVLDPEITSGGIALRGGQLGMLAPGGPGAAWMSVAWKQPERLASR